MKKGFYIVWMISIVFLLFAGCGEAHETINMQSYADQRLSEEIKKLSDSSEELEWEWFIRPGEYQNIRMFDAEFIGVEDETGKYGFLDQEKQMKVECQYFNVLGVSEGRALVLDSDRNYLFIDGEGESD